MKTNYTTTLANENEKKTKIIPGTGDYDRAGDVYKPCELQTEKYWGYQDKCYLRFVRTQMIQKTGGFGIAKYTGSVMILRHV